MFCSQEIMVLSDVFVLAYGKRSGWFSVIRDIEESVYKITP